MATYLARALFDYEKVEDSELSIKANSVVTVLEVNDSGWGLVSIVAL
jgi:hypothetical protein